MRVNLGKSPEPLPLSTSYPCAPYTVDHNVTNLEPPWVKQAVLFSKRRPEGSASPCICLPPPLTACRRGAWARWA